MPLIGNLDVSDRAASALQVKSFEGEFMLLPGVEILQVMYEIDAAASEAVLPAALHPSIPPTALFVFYKVPESPFGPFCMAHCRVIARAGFRSRSFLVSGAVDNPDAAEGLSKPWGFDLRPAEVALRHRHDRITGLVCSEGRTILEVSAVGPEFVSAADILYTPFFNLVRTPRGPRLVQIDMQFGFQKADRGRADVVSFEAAAWGDERLRPTNPISASYTVADLTLLPPSYALDPDRLALEGTERLR